MKTLKLFNAVLENKSYADKSPAISNDLGIIIEPRAVYTAEEIFRYYEQEKLSGNDLNKTFYNSWKTIKDSSRYELYLDQLAHYFSTYGTDFTGEVFIPREVVDIPDIKLVYKVVKAYTKTELIEKCLNLFRSGIALKEETINDILLVLSDLHYVFTGNEGIRNKEAIIKIADLHGVLPNDVLEQFRYIVYRCTNTTLLIKNKETVACIKSSGYDPSILFERNIEQFATIFNRFKPLFLAFKNRCPRQINKISKLSKRLHTPLVQNPLNILGSARIFEKDLHWLRSATTYALFRGLSYCYTRMNGQSAFLYTIRNGKSWYKETETEIPYDIAYYNYEVIMNELRSRHNFEGKSFYIPKKVSYALPTSEKSFVGNIPAGTKFTGKKLAVGIYWEDAWGARDLDLSGLNIGGKVGWNSAFKSGGLFFSGDITSAPEGAVEYLYATQGLDTPTLVLNNVFNGNPQCEYKIVVGKGSKVSHEYMMDPNKVHAEVKCQSVENQTILGLFMPDTDEEKQTFIVMNVGMGSSRVSGSSKASEVATKALYQKWRNPLMLVDVLSDLGAEFSTTPENADYDLSMSSLTKDSFVDIFK